MILSNNLIAASKETELMKQQELKAKSEMDDLKKELSHYKAENVDLIGKLKLTTSELSTAKASLGRMNNGSIKLDEILRS